MQRALQGCLHTLHDGQIMQRCGLYSWLLIKENVKKIFKLLYLNTPQFQFTQFQNNPCSTVFSCFFSFSWVVLWFLQWCVCFVRAALVCHEIFCCSFLQWSVLKWFSLFLLYGKGAVFLFSVLSVILNKQSTNTLDVSSYFDFWLVDNIEWRHTRKKLLE